ncbi:hypothetical protein FGL68_07090 [Acinetobacter baumannii]|nr:hypothetical protein [Acinetobacter baumannii]
MENFKRVLSLILCFLFLYNIIPIQVFAEEQKGWVIIKYEMQDGSDYPWGDDIVGNQTRLVNLENGSALYYPEEPDNARVEIVSVESSNLQYDKFKKKFIVTSENNNAENAGIITIKCKKRQQLIVQIINSFYDKNGKLIEKSGTEVKDVRNEQNFSYTPQVDKFPGYLYQKSTVNTLHSDGLPASKLGDFSKSFSFKINEAETELGYRIENIYVLDQLKPGKINISVTDNAIVNGEVYRLHGTDYFARTLNEYQSDNNGKLTLTVKSPKNGIFEGKELSFLRIVLTNGDGNVYNAWTDKSVIKKGDSPNSFQINVDTSKQTWYVHCFWDYSKYAEGEDNTDPPVTEGDGVIKFDPNSTDWTNAGKISEGVGKYPVRFYYEGQYPKANEATCKWKQHYTERKCSGSGENRKCHTVDKWRSKTSKYITYWLLDKIRVNAHNTDISPTYVKGDSGYIDILKENEGISLDALGEWENTKKSSTHKSITGQDKHVSDSEPQPSKPTGKSGKYNIDWTKPDISIDDANSRWVNSPNPYIVNVEIDENLSGFKDGDITVIDSSHYKRNSSDKVQYAAKVYKKKVKLHDGIYAITADIGDRAGNTNTVTKKTYYVDHEKPIFDFNIPSGIFSEKNGAVRKASKKGEDDSFYGKLTASDNLSGVNKIEFGWTFGNEKNKVEYETLYSSKYTYNDRYQEKIEKEIEKPVGDNLYLHVKIVDTAGNKDYKVFGPYEDPIKLRDFEVSDVRDPKWDRVFWNENGTPTGVKFGANKLPLDNTSNPIFKNADIKKGYAIYFNLTSEYLYREEDRITIRPTLYYVKDKERIEVDMYYELHNNPFVKCGSEEDEVTFHLKRGLKDVYIGKLSQLTLTKNVRVCKGKEWLGLFGWKQKYPADVQYKDGKEQYYYGKYYIPPLSVFVKKGDTPRPENLLEGGEILINFEILGYKNGEETLSTDQIFVYVPKQWQKEGGPKSNKFEPGDIVKYNGKKNLLRDFKTQITY